MEETIQTIYNDYGISEKLVQYVEKIEAELTPIFEKYQKISAHNSLKVLRAFHAVGVEERHFNGSSGYGMNDLGREKLGVLFATIFGGEEAIVSPLFSSGTHTLYTALMGLLRPKDTMLVITGRPYDTLISALGIDEEEIPGGLRDMGISYAEIPLQKDFSIDAEAVLTYLRNDSSVKVAYLQRSKGYEARPAFTIVQIKEITALIKKEFPDVYVFVDNCYGEFTETKEPTEVGVDVIAGSLIKNPGAGITPTGGYIIGTKKALNLIAARFTTPATGLEIGSYTPGYRSFFQGIYFAPGVVYTALKGAILFSGVFSSLGYPVCPEVDAVRADLPQSITFTTAEELITFVQAIQKASPIDHFAMPIADDMPGYDAKIIMASGSFIQGSTIELSADAPIRPPYTAYFQGGLTEESIKLALLLALKDLDII